MNNKKLVGKILEASNIISEAGRTAPANFVVCSRGVGEVVDRYIKSHKILSYDIVADPGFSKAKMGMSGAVGTSGTSGVAGIGRPYYSCSPHGVSGSSGTGGISNNSTHVPKGQKFTDLDPYGEEDWED
jgi:hypothetical protein